MTRSGKLDQAALVALRKARRKKMKAPTWGDHVLNGVRMFTTAGVLARLTGRTLEKR